MNLLCGGQGYYRQRLERCRFVKLIRIQLWYGLRRSKFPAHIFEQLVEDTPSTICVFNDDSLNK
jgi:hypothetical protein